MKFLKWNFIRWNKKERDRKDKVLQIFVLFAGNLSESVSWKECLNLRVFLFFYQIVSKFIKFRVFFKVLFRRILGWIFFQLNFLLVEFSFIWFFFFFVEPLLLIFIYFYYLGSFIQDVSDETNLLVFVLQFGPRILTKGSISSSW